MTVQLETQQKANHDAVRSFSVSLMTKLTPMDTPTNGPARILKIILMPNDMMFSPIKLPSKFENVHQFKRAELCSPKPISPAIVEMIPPTERPGNPELWSSLKVSGVI